VLAIGIVVDDAIVVVENVERNIEAGLSPHDAAVKSMDEVGAALVAIALVLSSVFIPSAFITGISGQFYRQFALTIAGATIISLIVSLTLSPALCSLLLKPHRDIEDGHWWSKPIHGFFNIFNRYFDKLTHGYGRLSAKLVRIAVLMLLVYAGVIAFGLNEFRKTPVGFIPQLDRGYLIIITQLPPAASLARTDEVNRKAVEIALSIPGIAHAVNIVGFSGATFTNAPNAGAVFVTLDEYTSLNAHACRSSLSSRPASLRRLLRIPHLRRRLNHRPRPRAGRVRASGDQVAGEGMPLTSRPHPSAVRPRASQRGRASGRVSPER